MGTGYGNFPWHSLTEFHDAVRMTVGTVQVGGATISTGTWCECRRNAEAKILSYLTNNPKKYRDMLYRVPGELAPQDDEIASDGSYAYAVAIPNIVTTPGIKQPRVWKNLTGDWRFRPKSTLDANRLTPTTDFTFNATTITIVDADVGDRFVIEYQTTLATVPQVLKQMSIYATAELALIRAFGMGSEQADKWAAVHRSQYMEQLKMMQTGQLSIQEFDFIKLYEDWKDESQFPQSFETIRA